MNKKKKPAQKSTTEVKKAAATETKGTTESKQKAAAPRVLDGVVPAKKPKKGLIALIIGALVICAVAAFALTQLMVGKADYSEALLNATEGQEKFIEQYNLARDLMKKKANSIVKSDRTKLETLVKDNMVALNKMAELKAIAKDKEAKEKFNEVKKAADELKVFSDEVIETAFVMAPVLSKFSAAQKQTTPAARIEYINDLLDELEKIEVKVDFNKTYVEAIIENFKVMLEVYKKQTSEQSVSTEDRTKVTNAFNATMKATRAWMSDAQELAKFENKIKDKFDSLKQYLESKK